MTNTGSAAGQTLWIWQNTENRGSIHSESKTYDEMENKTKNALLNPKRGSMFSEMLSYWLCVIHIADNGQITTIQGVITNWAVMKYASSKELEERFRYSTNNSHWIEYHNDDEENARKFEERFVKHKVTEQEKRDARIELIL